MRRTIQNVLTGALLALALSSMTYMAHATDEVTLDFELGGGNGTCGVFEPTASVRYDRDSTTVPVSFAMAVGPNGGCTGQAAAVEASVSHHLDVGGSDGGVFLDLTAAYQQQTVPIEYVRATAMDPFKHFAGIDVTAAQASAGWGYRFSDTWTASLGYNAVETLNVNGDKLKPFRLAVSGQIADVEIDVSAIENVTWVALQWEASENIVLSANAVRGMNRLMNDAPDMIGDYTRAGAPETVYRVGAGWRF